ncbi:enoyl-CoA hydratase [Alloalcanivorax xenomutans]|uniref:enoyl-CoA hydratase n=1 Tax=Alloalcanivorax xenomutans TaxID=1094342 RepID=UPI003A7FDAAF
MSDPQLLERLEQGVLWLTLNRPESRNALTPEMISQLRETLEKAAVDPAVRVVVLGGAGKGFCAGGDVKAMAKRGDPGPMEQRVTELRQSMESARLLHEMPKPTIAMARGAVAGAGLSLALACDFLIVSDRLKLTSAFVNVGLSGDFGSTYFLTHRLGHRARELALLSPLLDAAEAERLGLVNRVVADAELENVTADLAARLAAGPGLTQGHIKANLNAAEQGATLAQLLDQEAWRHIRCSLTEDHQEAASAFVEKRTPQFRNR